MFQGMSKESLKIRPWFSGVGFPLPTEIVIESQFLILECIPGSFVVGFDDTLDFLTRGQTGGFFQLFQITFLSSSISSLDNPASSITFADSFRKLLQDHFLHPGVSAVV